MKRKKSFLLVEVMISLALFSLCALPLLRQPFQLAQNCYNYFFENELARHAGNTHCTLLTYLQVGDIRWESLPKTPKTSYALPSKSLQLDLGDGIKKIFIQTTIIQCKSIKKITDQQIAILYEIVLNYAPQNTSISNDKIQKFTYCITAIGPSIT